MIATSGRLATAPLALHLLGLPEDASMITRDMVKHAKPDPDLFLAAAALLGVEPRDALVVGDSVWDMLAARRAGAQHRADVGRVRPRGGERAAPTACTPTRPKSSPGPTNSGCATWARPPPRLAALSRAAPVASGLVSAETAIRLGGCPRLLRPETAGPASGPRDRCAARAARSRGRAVPEA